jgi:hypothetical protein
MRASSTTATILTMLKPTASGDTLVLTTLGRLYAESFDEDMDEVVEVLERKQKILAKIICVPGER